MTKQQFCTSIEEMDVSRFKPFIIPLIALVAIAGIFAYSQFFHKNKASANASISGEVDFNGVVPTDSTISIYQRVKGTVTFEVVESGIVAADKAAWEWDAAEEGKVYDIKATLVGSNNNEIAESNILNVAAPATNEVLTINSPAQPETPGNATMSGTVGLNGYIPEGATVTIVARQTGLSQFNPVVTNLSASDGVAWSWDQAQSGQSYDVEAQLLDSSGNILSQSSILTAAAPATNEVLNITSNIAPPAPATVSISGVVDLNGNIPSNTTISIATRVTGQSQFNTIATGLSATNGIAWNWPQAQSGTSYDVQASLVQGNNTIATSQILTGYAPAANEVLIINAPTQAQGPSNTPSVQCVNMNSANQWSGTISFRQVQGAQQYWIQIGTSPQSVNNIFEYRYQPTDLSGNTYTYTTSNIFNNGTTYYIRYAYSNSATSGNIGDFSQFSNQQQFGCTPPNVPTNTPIPTATPLPTSTPVPPTNTPTVTPSPTNTPTPTPTLVLSPTGLLY